MKSFLAIAVVFILAINAVNDITADDTPDPRVSAVALFKNKAVLLINGKRRILKSGADSPEGVRLISSDSESATIAIAGKEIVLRLDGKIIGNYPTTRAANTVQLYPDAGGHYLIDGLIEGNGVRFLVDTGATSVVINKDTARRMGILYRVDGRLTRVETASGIVPAYNVEFDEVKVRTLSLKRVDGIVVDGSFPRVALLGQSFLNRLNMRRDGQMLELEAR